MSDDLSGDMLALSWPNLVCFLIQDQTRVSNETSPGRSIVIDHPEPASSPENSEPLLQECSDTDSGVTENRKSEKNSKMIYSVNESPPWWECVFLGFQVKFVNMCIVVEVNAE